MKNKNNKKKNIILIFLTQLIRIEHVFGWTAISFGGFILGMSSLDIWNYMIPLLVFFVSTICIISFTFAINNYYDADSDRNNPRRIHFNAIASGKISKQTGVFLNMMLVIIPLAASFFFKFEVFLFCIVFLTWMWIYSSPPLRLKSRPGLDIIWHFFAFILIVMWGSFIAGTIGLINWLAAISIGAFSLIGQVENHIYDYSFDKESGTKTFAVWIGLKKAKITLKILTFFHLILLIPLILLYTISYHITIISACSIAVLGLIFLKQKKEALSTQMLFVKYSTNMIGSAVYLSCLIYHFYFLLGKPTLGLLNSIGIP